MALQAGTAKKTVKQHSRQIDAVAVHTEKKRNILYIDGSNFYAKLSKVNDAGKLYSVPATRRPSTVIWGVKNPGFKFKNCVPALSFFHLRRRACPKDISVLENFSVLPNLQLCSDEYKHL
jgi:hypothetical protein